MQTEQPHAAFARQIEQLDIVVVDDSKSMQSILRSMLNALKVGRIRTYDGPQVAMDAMIVDPPHLVIVDWLMDPVDGLAMLKAMRTSRMHGLATVPAIVLTSSPTVRLVELAVRAGAHFVLAKPISPTTLHQRMTAICNDKRHFVLNPETDIWELSGSRELIAAQRSKRQQYRTVRDDYIKVARKQMAAMQIEPRAAVEPAAVEAAPPPAVPAPATAQPPMSAGARRNARKAVGFAARRVPQPEDTPGQPG